jgi:hypothetical protein
LAAVRVAGELEVHRMACDMVCVVRLVGQENHGFVRAEIVQSCVEVGSAS